MTTVLELRVMGPDVVGAVVGRVVVVMVRLGSVVLVVEVCGGVTAV